MSVRIDGASIDVELAQEAAKHRRVRGQAARLDRSDGTQPLLDSLIDLGPRFRPWVFRERQRQPHGQDVGRLGADLHAIEGEKAAHHERRTGEQHQCECHLGDDQGARPPASAPAAGTRSPA